VRDLLRRLDRGCKTVDVGKFKPASAMAFNAASACNWICDTFGITPSSVVSAAPTTAT
jgi:hypothetical protein